MDDVKYSRQRYVLGANAMQKLANSSVYLRGFGAIGVEIAKNLILTGVEKLTIHDVEIASPSDLNFNFFLDKFAVGKENRVIGSLKQMKELNPSVYIEVITNNVGELSFLSSFQCVVLTEVMMSQQIIINEFCRQHSPTIKFISANCFGILSSCFCDFGDRHEINDPDGEESKYLSYSQISKNENVITITLAGDERHHLEIDDFIVFRDIKSIECLNNIPHRVVSKSLESVQIHHDHVDCHLNYLPGGKVQKAKTPIILNFESYAQQVHHPKFIEAKMTIEESYTCHIALMTLLQYFYDCNSFPSANCEIESNKFFDKVREVTVNCNYQVDVNVDLLNLISVTYSKTLPPLAAFMGGVVAQEVLKGITNKFIPIVQWFHFNAADIFKGNLDCKSIIFDESKLSLSKQLCETLKSMRIFLVGCGAIGCEILKNLALLNVGEGNVITITDNDFVEKSNLPRQFLFRNCSIQKPKSVAAAKSIEMFRPSINIQTLNLKVGPDSSKVFDDDFFKKQDVVIGALDNIEGRRYLDTRCIDNCRPYLESGTFGTKGHVQVILPHLTESYSSQTDPVDAEIPYCTLKSFPSSIEHTIQWARDKFDSIFFNKPNVVRKFESMRSFWETNLKNPKGGFQLEEDLFLDQINWVKSALKHKPNTWAQCVFLARLKFEKYFNHKAKQLLFKFPPETKLSDDTLFWQFPRRLPTPVNFDVQQPLHFTFILSTSQLMATVWGIPVSTQEMTMEFLIGAMSSFQVPEFNPDVLKEIETDEKVMAKVNQQKKEMTNIKNGMDYLKMILLQDFKSVTPQEFEKDDEDRGHMNFITSASNLRAIMYGIEPAENDVSRRIAGNIIPAIITTTSAIAGLQTLELLKIAANSPKEIHQNCFMNLALTSFIFAEPAPAIIHTLGNGLQHTLWDKWEVHGHEEFTLNDFINTIETKYGIEVDTVVQGTKIIFMSFIPTYNTKLNQRMKNVLDISNNGVVVELIVGSGDISGPPIRYFLN